MRFQPRDYQAPIIDAIASQSSVWVVATMGAGKSAATLEGLRQLLDACMIERVLIVAPKRVAEHTWPAEIAKWSNFHGLSYQVAIGSPAQRRQAIDTMSDVTIINRENIPWLVRELGKHWPWDHVVIDESSSFKNSSSQRFKALKRIRSKVDRWTLLTGTPRPNSALELWSQAYLLDGGERLMRTFSAFRSRWFEPDYMGYNWTPRRGADDEIQDKIRDMCIVVERYDGLPARTDIIETIELPTNARDHYESMRRELLIEVESDEITAVNAAAMMGKLQQIANGNVYDEDGLSRQLHSAKLDALERLIESAGDEPVLVAYHYRHDLQRIKERLPDAVDIKDSDAIDHWNSKQVPVLLAHPASAGHGLNLQGGGNHIIWYGPTWSSELKQQFDARLYRQGQTKPVIVYTITADDTVDQQILEAVDGKVTAQDALIKAVKKVNKTKV